MRKFKLTCDPSTIDVKLLELLWAKKYECGGILEVALQIARRQSEDELLTWLFKEEITGEFFDELYPETPLLTFTLLQAIYAFGMCKVEEKMSDGHSMSDAIKQLMKEEILWKK